MSLYALLLLFFLPSAHAKTDFPKSGFVSDLTEACYQPGECGDQFTNWVHRGAQVTVLREKPSAGQKPIKFYEYKCADKRPGMTCWIAADKFLSSETTERAAVEKTSPLTFAKADAKTEKGKSDSREGDLVFVMKKENGFCLANSNSNHIEWLKCSDLAFDKESVNSALIIQRIKTYSQNSDAYEIASKLIGAAKKQTKQPFYSIIMSHEAEVQKLVQEQRKLEADPEYQACSGSTFEDIED